MDTITRRRFLESLAIVGASLPIAGIAQTAAGLYQQKPKLQICMFSKHLQWLAIPEMAKTVAQLGYDGVDLTVRKGGHIIPEKAKEDLPRAVAEIRKAGVDVPMIATDIIDPDNPLTAIILKAASESGIKYYRTAYLDYDASIGVARSLEKHKRQLQKLAALNKKYNIHGAYQNHAGVRVGAAVWDLWILLKDIDPRWLGVQYDPKHAAAEGGQSWIHDLDLLQAHVRCMDIKDFYWKKDGNKWKHQLVPLGEGMVDFDKYFQLVRQYNIAGPMSIHFEYDLGGAETGKSQLSIDREVVLAAMKKDLQTLRNMLSKAGLNYQAGNL